MRTTTRSPASPSRPALLAGATSRWARGAVLLAAVACGEPAALEVGPVGYTETELGVLGPEQQELLADLTGFGLAVAGNALDSVVTPFVERDLRSLALQRLAMEVAVEEAGVDDAALRDAYRADPEPELVVRHLVVLSERWRPQAHRDSARARAAEALRRARQGEQFEELVATYSDEPGAADRGGLLRPGREGSWVPEFWQAASSLEEGELSAVTETEFGYHVIRLEERRAVPFEEARGGVLRRMVDLPRALTEARNWAERQIQGYAVDTAAVLATLEGDTAVAEEAALVAWPDATPPFTAADLRRYVTTLAPDLRMELDGFTAEEKVGFTVGAARNLFLAARAEARGLRPTEAQREAIVRRWERRVAGWAEAIGFEPGSSEEEVKRRSLDGLGAQRQSAAIARSELPLLRGVLRERYPVRRPAQSSSSSDAVNNEMSG